MRPRILAISTTALGDTLLSVPALIALGRSFTLEVLVHQRQQPLLRGNPHLAKIYVYRNNAAFRFLLGLRLRQHYHRVLVMHANDDILRLLPRLRYQEAGNLQGWNRPEFNLRHVDTPGVRHEVDRRLLLARWAGAGEGEPRIRVFLSPRELEEGRRWWHSRGLGGVAPRVCLCVGAADAYKVWPAEYFGALARRLCREGAAVVLFGAGHERMLMQRVCRAAGLDLPTACGLPLRAAAAVLAGAHLLISNDTGPLHLAQAVQTPVLGLFGPTDPASVGPRNPGDRVLKVPRPCDPCLVRGCQDNFCLRALSPEWVWQEAERMLRAVGAAEGSAGGA